MKRKPFINLILICLIIAASLLTAYAYTLPTQKLETVKTVRGITKWMYPYWIEKLPSTYNESYLELAELDTYALECVCLLEGIPIENQTGQVSNGIATVWALSFETIYNEEDLTSEEIKGVNTTTMDAFGDTVHYGGGTFKFKGKYYLLTVPLLEPTPEHPWSGQEKTAYIRKLVDSRIILYCSLGLGFSICLFTAVQVTRRKKEQPSTET